MKKKFFALLIALVAVFSFSFALTACGEDKSGEEDKTDEGGNNKIVLTENTDFSALVSEKVDGEGWKAAFNDDIYTNYKSTLKISDDSETETDKIAVQQTDKIKILLGNNPYGTFYYGLDEKNVYVYHPDGDFDEDMVLEILPIEEQGVEIAKWYVSFMIFCPEFSDYYNKFTYNETTGAYEYSNSEGLESGFPFTYTKDTVYTSVSIKIINGQLAYLSAADSYDKVEVFFYDFGNTSFAIPEEIENAINS